MTAALEEAQGLCKFCNRWVTVTGDWGVPGYVDPQFLAKRHTTMRGTDLFVCQGSGQIPLRVKDENNKVHAQ